MNAMDAKTGGPGGAVAAGGFATTHWTLVAGTAEGDEARRGAALEQLCRLYWRPLRAFAERRGASRPDAEDLTQGFLADLVGRGAIPRADPTRGRFRSFLLAAFKHYIAHQRARAGRQKRGGGYEFVPLEALTEAGAAVVAATDEAGDDWRFDREWALQLLDGVLGALRDEYATAGRAALFDMLKAALWGGRGGVDYAALAPKLGMTAGAVQVAAHRLRRRFSEQLRAEVARTVLDPREVDDEVRHLIAAVAE